MIQVTLNREDFSLTTAVTWWLFCLARFISLRSLYSRFSRQPWKCLLDKMGFCSPWLWTAPTLSCTHKTTHRVFMCIKQKNISDHHPLNRKFQLEPGSNELSQRGTGCKKKRQRNNKKKNFKAGQSEPSLMSKVSVLLSSYTPDDLTVIQQLYTYV